MSSTPVLQTAAKAAAAALQRPVRPSAALKALLGGAATTTRADALKAVWQHIKAHKLQKAGAASIIVPDAALAAVFGGSSAEVKMTQIMGLVNKQLTAEPVAAAAPTGDAPKLQ